MTASHDQKAIPERTENTYRPIRSAGNPIIVIKKKLFLELIL